MAAARPEVAERAAGGATTRAARASRRVLLWASPQGEKLGLEGHRSEQEPFEIDGSRLSAP